MVFGRADHFCAEPGRNRHAGDRGHPPYGDFRADILSLEEGVRRARGWWVATREVTGGGEPDAGTAGRRPEFRQAYPAGCSDNKALMAGRARDRPARPGVPRRHPRILLSGEGWGANHERAHPLYRKGGQDCRRINAGCSPLRLDETLEGTSCLKCLLVKGILAGEVRDVARFR